MYKKIIDFCSILVYISIKYSYLIKYSDFMVKSVDVLGDTIMAAKDNDDTIWAGVRWMCQGMGMSDGQYKRQITNIQKVFMDA